MELIKFSEAYSLVDSKDNWSTSGQVLIESNNKISINFSTTLVEEASNTYVGNINFDTTKGDDKINISYSCVADAEDTFKEYADGIIDLILKQLNY